MSYIEKKMDLLRKKEEILREYDDFFREVMEFGKDARNLENEAKNPMQQLDLVQFITEDVEMIKLFRLMSALLYVENPSDKEIIAALKENIKINVKKMKKR